MKRTVQPSVIINLKELQTLDITVWLLALLRRECQCLPDSHRQRQLTLVLGCPPARACHAGVRPLSLPLPVTPPHTTNVLSSQFLTELLPRDLPSSILIMLQLQVQEPN